VTFKKNKTNNLSFSLIKRRIRGLINNMVIGQNTKSILSTALHITLLNAFARRDIQGRLIFNFQNKHGQSYKVVAEDSCIAFFPNFP
jgi:hypothetical protein